MTHYSQQQQDKKLRRIIVTVAGITAICGAWWLYNTENFAEPEKIELYPGAWIQQYHDRNVYTYSDNLFTCVTYHRDPLNFKCIPTNETGEKK